MAAKTNTVLTIPEPRRAALSTKPYPVAGPGFVIVEVAVAPVCKEGRIYRDHQFEWHDSPEHLGHEGVGTIVETAPGSRFEVGDGVVSAPTWSRPPSASRYAKALPSSSDRGVIPLGAQSSAPCRHRSHGATQRS